jgi:hypothetical protein
MPDDLTREVQVRQLFREHGYEIVAIRHSGHWQVKARRGNGPVRHFTVGLRASDPHSRKNLVAALRRGYSVWRTC